MGAVVDRAKAIALELEEAGVKASHDVRQVQLPGILVVPVPNRDYTEGTLGGSYDVTWALWALTKGPGDLRAAEELETIVDTVAGILPIETAEASSYKVPGSTDPLPGYRLTMHDQIETNTGDPS